jgi:hypothetical protein
VLAQWIDRAQQRVAVVQAFFADGRDRISVQFMRSNAGWIGTVTLPEAATRLEYRADAQGAFRATALLAVPDPRTGRPMPNPSFELPSHQGETDIALRYLDASGVESPVATVAFHPETALRQGMRRILEQISASWLAFGTGQNSTRLYFTVLVSYRCAIERVEIGYNGGAPQERIALPPCDPANPFAVPGDVRPYLDLRNGVESVTVRLTFFGGNASEARTFPRPK